MDERDWATAINKRAERFFYMSGLIMERFSWVCIVAATGRYFGVW